MKNRNKTTGKFAIQLRNNPSPPETIFWLHVRQRQIFGLKFRRQHPIGDYVTDFVCLEKKLIIELDGGDHCEPENERRDNVRTVWLNGQGFRVIRFWSNDVLNDMNGVLEELINELGY